jgi:hypothetical protein
MMPKIGDPFSGNACSSSDVGARRTLLACAFIAAASLIGCSAEPSSLADYIAAICSTPFRAAPEKEAQYLAENVAAMTKMMVDMGIRPSGDVDADFVAMMVPHHQGAIEMAQAELRYGRNERLRRMAQEIIVTQQQEIAAMHFALGGSSQVAPRSSVRASITAAKKEP